MQTRHPKQHFIFPAIFILIVLSWILILVPPSEAGGLPKDLGVRMAKISVAETGLASKKKSELDEIQVKRLKIKSDPATIKLSTERIELSQILAMIEAATSPAEPDKTAKATQVRLEVETKIEEVEAAKL
ncbi:hypothetical protein HQ585_13960 [candidate division KSB1 bacterium]|nr:hypothetical protein [candidate division KSB1 bacterium]